MNMPLYDQHATVPPGYTTAAALAAQYNRSTAGVRVRMVYDHVPSMRCVRRNADGVALGGHAVIAYHEPSAHAALRREDLRSRATCPGYIGLIARAFKLTRAEVRDALAAAGVPAEQRTCKCCGKPTLYYPDRTAAHAALNAYMRLRLPAPAWQARPKLKDESSKAANRNSLLP